MEPSFCCYTSGKVKNKWGGEDIVGEGREAWSCEHLNSSALPESCTPELSNTDAVRAEFGAHEFIGLLNRFKGFRRQTSMKYK